VQKPVPRPTAETREFGEACARGELLYQVCAACRQVQFYPRQHCAACQGAQMEWSRSAGSATVYSHTTVYRAPTAAFKADVPYVIALVDVDEGFRMMVNVLGCDPAEVRIGTRVRIVFREAGGGIRLPQAEIADKV
jgi:uncharacterized OB-fold protein